MSVGGPAEPRYIGVTFDGDPCQRCIEGGWHYRPPHGGLDESDGDAEGAFDRERHVLWGLMLDA